MTANLIPMMTADAEVAAQLTQPEARRLTERIRVALDRVAESWADLGDRITEAHARRADTALGYESWEEYVRAELHPAEGMAAEVRRQLVGALTAAGMSTRAIAPTVGVSNFTVSKDRQLLGDLTPGGAIGVPPTPRKVVGLDGKTYTVNANRMAGGRKVRAAEVSRLAGLGCSTRQIAPRIGVGEDAVAVIAKDFGIEIPADKFVKRTRRIDTNRIVENTVTALDGLGIGLELIVPEEIDQTRAAAWLASLNESLRPVTRLGRQIKESMGGGAATPGVAAQ